MTTSDGNPLTGDTTSPDVRHLLEVARGHLDNRRHAPTPTRPPTYLPIIHEPCIMGQCGGCTAHTCRTRTTLTGPAQETT